jgi:hypothetical protein
MHIESTWQAIMHECLEFKVIYIYFAPPDLGDPGLK